MTDFPDAPTGVSLAAALNAGLGADPPHVFTASQERSGSSLVSISDGHSQVSVITGKGAYVLWFGRQSRKRAHGATPDKHQVAGVTLAWLAGHRAGTAGCGLAVREVHGAPAGLRAW